MLGSPLPVHTHSPTRGRHGPSRWRVPGRGLLPGGGSWLQASTRVPAGSQVEAPGNATSATVGPLSSSTAYSVRVTCLYPGGSSSVLTGRLTTREWAAVAWGPGLLHTSTRRMVHSNT